LHSIFPDRLQFAESDWIFFFASSCWTFGGSKTFSFFRRSNRQLWIVGLLPWTTTTKH
jgi:hypothetical protein